MASQLCCLPGPAAAEQATSGSCAATGSGIGAATFAGSEAGNVVEMFRSRDIWGMSLEISEKLDGT